MRDAFVSVLEESAEANPRLALITGDLGFGVLDNFARRFPNQFLNVGVAEQNMTAVACGMALSGWKVFTYSIANFAILRCLEQLRNDICYHNADVTVVSVGGGFSYGQLGMSHFATEDLAIMRALPNMTVVAPGEKWEAVDLTRQIIKKGGPAYLRIDKGCGGQERRAGEVARLGTARIVREGNDIALITIGSIVREALMAADIFHKAGIEARVIDMHTLKPLDEDTIIKSCKETSGIICIEEHNIIGGLGGAVAEVCLKADIKPGFFRHIGLRDIFPQIVGDQNYLRAAYQMDAKAIVDMALRIKNRHL